MKNNDAAKHDVAERPTTGLSEAGRTTENTTTGRAEARVVTTEIPTTGRSEARVVTTEIPTTGRSEARVVTTEIPTTGRSETGRTTTSEAEAQRAWLEKYEPVERAIVEAHERRVESRRRNRREADEARRHAAGDLMEATEGFVAVWRREGWTFAEMVAWAGGDVWTFQCLARFVRLAAARSSGGAAG